METLSETYVKTVIRKPKPPLKGLDEKVFALAGNRRRGGYVTRKLFRTVREISSLAPEISALDEDELTEKLFYYRTIFRRQGRDTEKKLAPALACIREAAHRATGLRPYDVQIAGALAMHQGYVAEMATGEGKTLTAVLTAILLGWTGHPVHVITVNDYLAQRDSDIYRDLYNLCGVTVGHVLGEMQNEERHKNYRADVVYITSKQIVADFLRDRLAMGNRQQYARRHIRNMLEPSEAGDDFSVVMRGIHYGIVDEADSVLIDEAVTPLIISRKQPNPDLELACRMTSRWVGELEEGLHYKKKLRYREIELLPAIEDFLRDKALELPVLYRQLARQKVLFRQALNAREYFHLNKQYIIDEDKVVIVDEFTGRLMPERSWSAGLHQLIEAKEGVKITPPTETLARLSFQKFFRFFHQLSGMTGTAMEAARELWNIYHLPVVRIPPNKPIIRILHPLRIFPDAESKWKAVVDEAESFHRKKRPVLVGTRNIYVSELIAKKLEERGLACQVLNAKNHREEAEIISQAGRVGRITIATNMAGRGTDIKLDESSRQAGGLHVITTEGHESPRIDRQFFGRSSRQGDPGSARAYLSLEDELFRKYLPKTLQGWLPRLLGDPLRGSSRLGAWALSLAQRTAERQNFLQRTHVLQTDNWLENSLSFTPGDVYEV